MRNELNAILIVILILSFSTLKGQTENVDEFDKSYNNVRIQLGIPIIEDSWVRYKSSTATRVKWMDEWRGSLPKNALHLAKMVRFENGQLASDQDTYSKFVADSINYRVVYMYKFVSKEWLSNLEIHDYHSATPTLKLFKIKLEKADSIINSWGLSRKSLPTK